MKHSRHIHRLPAVFLFAVMVICGGSALAAGVNDLHGTWVVDVEPSLTALKVADADKDAARKTLSTLVISYDVHARHVTVAVPGSEKRRIDVREFIENSDGSIHIVSEEVNDTVTFLGNGTIRVSPSGLVLKKR
ncbi:hypothetical protein LJC23_07450 [Desulfovibrio sp. OttesenSCG-928-I05]|nr:hypothetical protein [Desulfovibrio sp. OttesenSCG-928-I05]